MSQLPVKEWLEAQVLHFDRTGRGHAATSVEQQLERWREQRFHHLEFQLEPQWK
jgi:hypothetical protein